jgi:Ca-activated chloride channel family protein
LKLLSNRTRLFRALFIACFLVLPLVLPPVFLSGATNHTQQPSTVNAQDTPPAASVTQTFRVTVTDSKNRLISDLTKEEFAVREGKLDHEVSYFNTEDVPASIALLVDVSGSIDPRAIGDARHAAVRFMGQSHPGNKYFVGEFSRNLRELADWTSDSRTINDALNKLATENGTILKPKPRGLTALYDTSITVLEKLAHAPHSKRVLLLITDGGSDTDSKRNLNDVKRKIRESNVLLYVIAIKKRGEPYAATFVGQDAVHELANVSGGRAYFIESREVNEVVDRIALELRQQYVIGFTPTKTAPGGKWNKVKIKVTPRNKEPKNLYVRSREGYFSPPAATP